MRQWLRGVFGNRTDVWRVDELQRIVNVQAWMLPICIGSLSVAASRAID